MAAPGMAAPEALRASKWLFPKILVPSDLALEALGACGCCPDRMLQVGSTQRKLDRAALASGRTVYFRFRRADLWQVLFASIGRCAFIRNVTLQRRGPFAQRRSIGKLLGHWWTKRTYAS